MVNNQKQITLKLKTMKLVVPFFASALLITACNSKPQTNADAAKTTPVTITADTTGLAQFQTWKAQHELANPAQYNNQPVAAAPARTSTSTHHAAHATPVSNRSSESANTAKAAEKKGWSKAAKGAAIGAGTGAVVGAVVNKKNRVVGGVVGGIAGGATGYGIGRHMDKKEGRY